MYPVARNIARVALRARARSARHEHEAVMLREVEKQSAVAGSEADAVRGWCCLTLSVGVHELRR